MKEKLMLRETSELWRKMEEAGDVQKFQVERRQLLKDIEKAEEQLKKSVRWKNTRLSHKILKIYRLKLRS